MQQTTSRPIVWTLTPQWTSQPSSIGSSSWPSSLNVDSQKGSEQSGPFLLPV